MRRAGKKATGEMFSSLAPFHAGPMKAAVSTAPPAFHDYTLNPLTTRDVAHKVIAETLKPTYTLLAFTHTGLRRTSRVLYFSLDKPRGMW